jgi:hypothetical protein
LKFVPYHQLGDTPNLIVDGQSHARTLLSLSHWPQIDTPKELRDDLSAQIVFRYLDQPRFHVNVPAVSNDHFDEDGLVGIYTVLNPEHALKHKDLLIDIASAGDFGTYKLPQTARAAFVLSSFADKERSPLPHHIFERPYPEMASTLYQELLPILGELLDNPQKYEQWWQAEEQFLIESTDAITSGVISIEEIPDLDLAIVHIPESWENQKAHRFTQSRRLSCHPFAINNSTSCFRILLIKGSEYELQYRYETWVQYVSRRPMPRVNLESLANTLTEMESNGAVWKFDGVQKITPSLKPIDGGRSSLNAGNFISHVEEFLKTAPAAWNPYAVTVGANNAS